MPNENECQKLDDLPSVVPWISLVHPLSSAKDSALASSVDSLGLGAAELALQTVVPVRRYGTKVSMPGQSELGIRVPGCSTSRSPHSRDSSGGSATSPGGKATQRAAVLPVVWLSKLVSLPLLAIYLIATYVPVTAVGLAWGGLAGVTGVVGLVLFYRALSAGAMTVVAPITGVTSAAIPVVVGLVAGERPSTSRLLGVGCALLAIALVSISPRPQGHRQLITWRLVVAALGAGISFALFFILIAVAGESAGGSAGMWPILGSQLSALIIGGLLLLMTRPGPWPRQAALRWAMVAGPCDMTANASTFWPLVAEISASSRRSPRSIR